MSTFESIDKRLSLKPYLSPGPEYVDWNEFEKFHKFLMSALRFVYKNLKHEEISYASLFVHMGGNAPTLSLSRFAHQMLFR